MESTTEKRVKCSERSWESRSPGLRFKVSIAGGEHERRDLALGEQSNDGSQRVARRVRVGGANSGAALDAAQRDRIGKMGKRKCATAWPNGASRASIAALASSPACSVFGAAAHRVYCCLSACCSAHRGSLVAPVALSTADSRPGLEPRSETQLQGHARGCWLALPVSGTWKAECLLQIGQPVRLAPQSHRRPYPTLHPAMLQRNIITYTRCLCHPPLPTSPLPLFTPVS
jgi:hypothetical protein